MANGYQQRILDGASFADWVRFVFDGLAEQKLESTRALRRDSWFRKTEREYRAVARMPLVRAIPHFKREAVRRNLEHLNSYEEQVLRRAARIAAYSKMLAEVHRWRAPRALAEIKARMIAIINDGIKHDCGAEKPPTPWSWEKYAEWTVTTLRDALKFQRSQRKRERLRIKESNATIRAFRRLLAKHPLPAKTHAA